MDMEQVHCGIYELGQLGHHQPFPVENWTYAALWYTIMNMTMIYNSASETEEEDNLLEDESPKKGKSNKVRSGYFFQFVH